MFVSHIFTLLSFVAVLAVQAHPNHPSSSDYTYSHSVGREIGSSQWSGAVTTVRKGSNVIVKLDCLGCPFRLRTEDEEIWEEPPRENALVNHLGN